MNASTQLLVLSFLAASATALAQQPAAYPAKGQNSGQQASDTAACREWAQKQTGIDPNVASQPAPQQTGPAVGGGHRVRGAARGAAAGAVLGGVANGDSGRGASNGAKAGVVAGGMRARQERRANNAAANQQQAQSMTTFNQAYGSCMKGRGYTVS